MIGRTRSPDVAARDPGRELASYQSRSWAGRPTNVLFAVLADHQLSLQRPVFPLEDICIRIGPGVLCGA